MADKAKTPKFEAVPPVTPGSDLFAREHPLRGRPISEQRSGKLRYAGAVHLGAVVDLLSPDS